MTTIKQTDRDAALVADIRKQAAIQIGFDGPAYQTLTRWADRIEALSAEVERLRTANRALRRGLYGLMDSDDADTIATTLEAGGVVDWDNYPPSARAALEATK